MPTDGRHWRSLYRLAIRAIAVILAAPAVVGAVSPLNAAEERGYVEWLHSLEQTTKVRLAGGKEEVRRLYPFGSVAAEESKDNTLHSLSVSRALGKLESAREFTPKASSAFAALAMARNYGHLSEYDSALVWYDRTALRDTAALYVQEVGQEALATSIVLADSLHFITKLLNTLGASQLAGREEELILAYRSLLVADDQDNLRLLLRKVGNREEQLSPKVRYWHAFALATRQQWEPALRNLRRLVLSGGLAHGLTEWERTWVATAIPDLLFLLDQHSSAANLYRQLGQSELTLVRPWARYQLANLDFLSRRYAAAWAAYKRICENEDSEAWWRERACNLASLVDEIDRIRAEGEPYGTATYFQP